VDSFFEDSMLIFDLRSGPFFLSGDSVFTENQAMFDTFAEESVRASI